MTSSKKRLGNRALARRLGNRTPQTDAPYYSCLLEVSLDDGFKHLIKYADILTVRTLITYSFQCERLHGALQHILDFRKAKKKKMKRKRKKEKAPSVVIPSSHPSQPKSGRFELNNL